MWLEHLKHSHAAFEFNGALGSHGACNNGANHLKKEQIKWQSNGSSKSGHRGPIIGMEHLEEVWSTLVHACTHHAQGTPL